MLYRTHHPFFFHFNPHTPSSTSPLPSSVTTPPPPPPPNYPIKAEVEMECVERALKSSLRREAGAKVIHNQGIVEDLWAATNGHGQACVDEFFVDDFLDLSNGDGKDNYDDTVPEPEHEHTREQGLVGKVCSSVPPKQEEPTGNCNSSRDNFPPLPPSELSVPADDLADLEWLSQFVEDSFTEYTLACPGGSMPVESKDCSQPDPPKSCFNAPVPAKARTKRARTGGRVWSLGSPSATADTSSASSSSSTSSSPSSAWLINAPVPAGHMGGSSLAFAKRPAKNLKRKHSAAAAEASHHAPPPPRRCSHCHVQKTPQWRTGPLGAKTLCNACGVRFKSGRLLPEYRPACSPTFSSDLHSNNHRKVLEMRRKKETEVPEPGVVSGTVQSF